MEKEKVWNVRRDFPILNTQVNGNALCYFDNAATTQVPEPVLNQMLEHYHTCQANVHRGVHTLSERSTAHMEHARIQMQHFLGAEHPHEIIFTSGTTASINLVARSLSFSGLKPGDEIITTEMEHHSNLIPWQEACRRTGAVLRIVPVTPSGELNLSALQEMLSSKTRLLAVTCVSNVTGTVNPVREIAHMVHAVGARILLDGAQALRHGPVNVRELGCDYFCLSGHKMMGPTGTGVLYGTESALEALIPETYGGGMVEQVWVDHATFDALPFRLEAGTPNIVGNIGLGAAAEYLIGLDLNWIVQRENTLLQRAIEGLADRNTVEILGNPFQRAGCISFNLKGVHPLDVAKLLDQLGIEVRSGHHCAQPLLTALGQTGAVRLSPAFYNTEEEIDRFLTALDQIVDRLGRRTLRGIHRRNA